MVSNLILPIVHMNGTSKGALLAQNRKAWDAINDAYAALKQAAPNARDYYPVPGLYPKAIDQHMDRLRRLDSVADELRAEAEAIYDM